MTLTVEFYSYDNDHPGSVKVGALRWTEGGEVEVVSRRGHRLDWLVEAPIMVGGPQIFCSESAFQAWRAAPAERVVDPERFMRGLCLAYAGHFYASAAVEL